MSLRSQHRPKTSKTRKPEAMNPKEANSITFCRGSEVSQDYLYYFGGSLL